MDSSSISISLMVACFGCLIEFGISSFEEESSEDNLNYGGTTTFKGYTANGTSGSMEPYCPCFEGNDLVERRLVGGV